MSYILHIETSTIQCSVSIAYKGEYIAGKQLLVNEFIHGKKLHVFIKDILEKTKINLAKFAIPKYIRIMKEFPKTQTGKIIKHALRTEGITNDTWKNNL